MICVQKLLKVHCSHNCIQELNIPAVVMFVQRINIPGYNVYTDLNHKNSFKTVEILFYNFVVHVPFNKFKTQ